ncbi:latex serine proteinase inhibitor-like [Rutidosis leptorrhynchoides]|uniref:latex serine proteinase inhibitor-like n=1 Tax=Rutidosis leptorrhynchoides TaxID=125765 RepID=UPI003A99A021
MNTSLSSYVLIILFTITTQSIFFTTITSVAEVVVKDATGKKVLDNVGYGLGLVASGGRIKLTNTDNKKKICPLNVVHDPNDNKGGVFMFTMVGYEKYLKTSRVLGIDSGDSKTGCTKSTFWTINDAEAKAPGNLITTGGRFEDENTCFQVVEYPKPTNPKVPSYMIQHCPEHCESGSGLGTCFNVSIYEHNGVKRLSSVGTTPFEFVFYKLST